MSERLDQLYRQVILEAANKPHNEGHLVDATNEITLKNPSCGDVLTLQLAVENGTVTGVAYHGEGCTISKASASLMTDQILHRSVTQVEQLVQAFSDLMLDGDARAHSQLGDAAIFAGVHQFPARIKCATLAWKAASQALAKGEPHDRDEEY
ncbi:Fe-S cluster assembly sulfur transfer protein SufU [Lacticaseibacillus brantae]|uniref:Fe-S cluster formation protein, NifU-like n=1 Tax=Lacticaseibacillus brantae DSM 23927 TaxID=1423727 RepID=A0A0R2B067_9LACO|nr:SUF system NifU family Fe-S cluster assembly protein [Lacticaseibacillus brantae]KRM72925.1 Fe-S cluster formation protein, NifU-like [Lacticaseibacillus brantae DSM 23927]